ncbi:MAG: site-specific integrase [Chitinophagaceae bacterium]|nr:MAG: site-specific integrase [Chitinophagaceae bacterium]
MKRIRVTLRKKTIASGRLSLYLDFYPPFFNSESGEYSRREFLKLYLIAKPASPIEKILNAENLHRAELICSRRQNEVNKEFIYTPFELEELRKKETGRKSFLEFFKKEASLRTGKNLALWESAIKHFEKFLNDRDLLFEEVDAYLIEDFRSYLLKTESIRNIGKKLSQNTALSYFNKAKATLRKAYKLKMLQSDVNAQVDGIKEVESERNHLTLEESIALYNTPCIKEIVKRVSLFSLLTGMRYSDIAKLKWADLHNTAQGHFIRFRQQKTQKNELMPISEHAYKLMAEHATEGEIIFKGLKKWDVDRVLPIWVSEAGITKHITFHCFRHTYATLQISAGTDLFTVSKMLGHKSIKTTQIYAKLVDEKKIQAAGKIMLE